MSKPATHPIVTILKPIASLQLTVTLFAFSVLLVFFGTLAQKGQGIWTVVDQYFWSWVVLVDVQHTLEFLKIFFGLPADVQSKEWAKFPLPGGKLLGFTMFFNLLAAHALRFKLTWKRSGIFILHGGLLLMGVGEFITREFQVEQQMHVPEGQAVNYAFDTRNYELAIVDVSDSATDHVIVLPAKRLQRAQKDNTRVVGDLLPFDVAVVQYFKNSDLVDPVKKGLTKADNPATAGFGLEAVAVRENEVSGVDMSAKVDVPSAYVTLYKKGTDEPLGTYLVSIIIDKPQPIEVDGKPYTLQLRFTRYYKPFTLTLNKFRFDRYIGTTTAKNYSSELLLTDAERDQTRVLTVSMNDPLRYRGETFYQSSFTPDEKTTILQVVRNPGWFIPYVSCGMVTGGMVLHFGIFLVQFLLRLLSAPVDRPREAKSRSLASFLIPAVVVPVAVLFVAFAAMPGRPEGDLNLAEAARLPVVDGGRIKPLDTVARIDLRLITHAEQFTVEKKTNDKVVKTTYPAIKWFFDAASGQANDPGPAASYRIFRIENDRVRELLFANQKDAEGKDLQQREGLRYSVEEIKPAFEKFDEAARAARNRPEKDRDLFEVKILELRKHLEIYIELWQGQNPLLLPPGNGKEWRTPASGREVVFDSARATVRAKLKAMEAPDDLSKMTDDQKNLVVDLFESAMAEERQKDPAFAAWDDLLAAYRSKDQKKFDKAVGEYRKIVEKGLATEDLARARFEVFMNDTALYYQCTIMYVMALVAVVIGWVVLFINPAIGNGLRRAAFWWLVVTFAVHTFTLISRMYLMDRPLVFVTNLYSSAVFIGWGVVALGLIIELLYPITTGNLLAAALGFGTSLIAHNLAASGDTLEMMQAVLDTNFWLATHVTTVTLGYAATYVAGTLALFYVVIAMLPPQLLLKQEINVGRRMEFGRAVGQILYGVICFAALLSFTGTVLGGIWADQSWGRFWGWDPKENGAVLIVIWNALILHARWAGLVKDRGIAVLALVGNMITTWSWFGTNQLGVGLHAYGFSNTLAFGCMLTWVLHLPLIGLGMVPWERVWGGARTTTKPGNR